MKRAAHRCAALGNHTSADAGSIDVERLARLRTAPVVGRLVGMLAHVRDRPVPPSQVSELAVPPELEELILACLEKDPSKRPRSADELRLRFLSCPPAGTWTQEHARKWWEVHRPTAAARVRPTAPAP